MARMRTANRARVQRLSRTITRYRQRVKELDRTRQIMDRTINTLIKRVIEMREENMFGKRVRHAPEDRAAEG